MRVQYEVQYQKNDKAEPTPDADEKNLLVERIAVGLSWLFVVIFFPFSICLCLVVAKEFQRLVMFRLGRIRNCYGPGLVWQLPCIDSYNTVDIRTNVANVNPQEMLTKDSVTITVNAVVFYCIYNPIDSIIKVDDAQDATERISQVTLRNIVGSKKLHELLTSRQQLSLEIQKAVAEITGRWGVRVERVDVMEISLPSSLERSLASEAEATREARAKIILAEGEAKASQALKDCSDVMSENQISLQLRHLQILSSLAQERRVNIIFPIPLAIMEAFMDGKESSEPTQEDEEEDQEDDDDQDDYLNLFSPKVYITGSPPESLNDLKPDADDDRGLGPSAKKSTKEENEQEKTIPVRSWQWPAFFRSWRRPNDDEQPSSSRRVRTEDGQPTSRRRPRRPDEVDPYPLLPDSSERYRSKSASTPIPPRPDPPPLPQIPPHPQLPPIPPHPTLPRVPDPPKPPPKSSGK